MKLILASNNEKKLREMREILSELGITVLSQREAGLNLEVEETGTTFAENALLKAQGACDAAGMAAVADDSGLVVDALDGAPGVYSARYGGEGLNDRERFELLLKNMEDREQRSCRFVSSIACVFPGGAVIRAEGTCEGQLLYAPKGENGFGYDPIFYVPEQGCSMAELSPAVKNRLSHRGKALAQFVCNLRQYLKEHPVCEE